MGKGSSGATTSTSSQPPQWLQNNLQSLYGQAQNVTSAPLQQYSSPTVAGFTPTQTSAMNTINNSQGITTPYYNAAAQEIGNATQPIWNETQQFSPSAISQYQSPYTQQVVNATQAQLNQNDAVQQQQLMSGAIQSGASPFGGDRAGVAAAALAGQQDLANNQTMANINNQAYTQALGEFNTQQQNQLGANEATSYLQQQGAAGLQNLGTNAQQSALSGASAQLQSGALQQELGQEQLNVPYEQFVQQQAYPYQQLSALESAAGLTGSIAGGTGTTTTPSPSTASQIGALGTAGLATYGTFAKDGGVAAYADGGALPHYDSGGLTNVPDLSLSYITSSPSVGSYKGNAPAAPKVSTSMTQSGNSSGFNPAGLTAAAKGAKALWNGTGASGGVGGYLGIGSPASNALAGTEVMPAGVQAAEDEVTGDLMAGSDIGYGTEGAFAGIDGLMGTEALGATVGDAALTGIGMDAADLGFMAMFAKKGGVARYDSGGAATATDSPMFTYVPSKGGVSIPQLNNSALYGSGNNPDYNAVYPLANLKQTSAPTVVSPNSTSASIPSSSNQYSSNPQYSPVGSSQFTAAQLAGLDQLGSSLLPSSTVFTPITDPNSFSGSNFIDLNPGNTEAAALGLTPTTANGSYEYSYAKKGGVAHYDGGGVTPFDTSTNPMMNNQTAQYAKMPAQQLRQLAQQVPQGSPQQQIIGKVLQQKQTMPNSGQTSAMSGPQGMTAPSGPMQGGMGMKSGGMAHFADGGDDEQMSPALQQDDANASMRSNVIQALDPDGLPDNAPRDVHPAIEAQKDDMPDVDHSGDTVKVNYKSEGKSLDLGIPSQPDKKPSFLERNAPLMSFLSGMAASKSPFSSVAIGQGGEALLKEMGEQRNQTREEAAQQANQQYQQGQLSDTQQRNLIEQQKEKAYEKHLGIQESMTQTAARRSGQSVEKGADGRLYMVDKIAGTMTPLSATGTGTQTIGQSDGAANQPSFGFDTSTLPSDPAALKGMQKTDQLRKKAYDTNSPIINNMLNTLDEMEPNYNLYNTGVAAPEWRAAGEKAIGMQGGTAAANIDKGSNSLATDWQKFQYVPGGRGSVLGLKTILGSKPGLDQPAETNRNISSDIRAKLSDYDLSEKLNDRYRELSPLKIADSNADNLNEALSRIYPLKTVDQKTGQTAFHPENAAAREQAISDAIANPKKYIAQAQSLPTKYSGAEQSQKPTSSQAPAFDYNSIKSGEKYTAPDGTIRIKP